jgi:hypothetical protein
MVDNDSLLLRSMMIKTGRPAFEGLEAERKGVLPWREAATVVDHHLVAGEHVPGLEVPHFEVTVGGSTDVLGAEVVFFVAL